jgi:hypothetical protein
MHFKMISVPMQQFVLPLESGQARIRSSVREAGKRRERENAGNRLQLFACQKLASVAQISAFSILATAPNHTQEWLLAYCIGLQRQHTTQRYSRQVENDCCTRKSIWNCFCHGILNSNIQKSLINRLFKDSRAWYATAL